LAFEGFLIEHLQQVGDMIVLPHRVLARGFESQKYVAREKRLPKYYSLASIFVSGVVTGQGARDALAGAVFHQLLFSSGLRVCDEPTEF
jgi:hypothetical protein